MSKKKRFGISEALTRGLSETINVVENNAGIFRNVILPLSRIELDPENPRKLAINLVDVKFGLQAQDPLYTQKQEELESLRELSYTIKTNGVINPIIVYKLGEIYRVVAGERRCLASILAGKKEIEARVFNEKPKGFDLKLIQWIENTAREDLTLDERLGNVREIVKEYQLQNPNVANMNATILKNITGLSLSQCTYYITVLNAPQDVKICIQSGKLRNLDKAALIANIASPEVRKEAIEACIAGSSLKELRTIINQKRITKKHTVELNVSTRGRATVKINLGSTSSTKVVETIIDSILKHQSFEKYLEVFSNVNWADLRQSAKAFRKVIEILEVEIAV